MSDLKCSLTLKTDNAHGPLKKDLLRDLLLEKERRRKQTCLTFHSFPIKVKITACLREMNCFETMVYIWEEETDRQTDRQRQRRTDRQIDRQTNRQTEREGSSHTGTLSDLAD